jgi:hypothetical protein
MYALIDRLKKSTCIGVAMIAASSFSGAVGATSLIDPRLGAMIFF